MRLGTRNFPIEYYVLKVVGGTPARPAGKNIVGYFAEHAIFGTVVDCAGHSYRYVGVMPRLANGHYDVESLRSDEWIVEPGLIYRSMASGRIRTNGLGRKYIDV